MKKIILIALLFVSGISYAAAQAEIKFDQTVHDFGKFSESCLEVWCGAKATKLLVENEDNKYGKLGGYNYGSVFVDIEL